MGVKNMEGTVIMDGGKEIPTGVPEEKVTTPGLGQWVNAAGVEVHWDSSAQVEEGSAING
jgi:hypothetical protein